VRNCFVTVKEESGRSRINKGFLFGVYKKYGSKREGLKEHGGNQIKKRKKGSPGGKGGEKPSLGSYGWGKRLRGLLRGLGRNRERAC